MPAKIDLFQGFVNQAAGWSDQHLGDHLSSRRKCCIAKLDVGKEGNALIVPQPHDVLELPADDQDVIRSKSEIPNVFNVPLSISNDGQRSNVVSLIDSNFPTRFAHYLGTFDNPKLRQIRAHVILPRQRGDYGP